MIKLIIGEKNYSTWSMRPWVFLTAFKVPFEEKLETLTEEDTLSDRLRQYSPAARVPVLQDGVLTIWDSLAICEYVSEQYLNGAGLPKDNPARARARVLTVEMHAGFTALRTELPMNIRARRRLKLSAAALRDIRRIDDIWAGASSDDGWLCGSFSIADCFYAPVAMRFLTYADIPLSDAAREYQSRLINAEAVVAWQQQALQETTIVRADETGEPIKGDDA